MSYNPAPINYNMGQGLVGSYGGLKLEPPDSRWKRAPADNTLKTGPIVVFQGTPLPLPSEVRPSDIPEDSMFIFSRNYASPYCNSDFSTDGGQLCTTKQQRDYIGLQRGGNKTTQDLEGF